METLNPPFLPVSQLTRVLYEDLPSSGAELFVAPHLLHSIQTLGEVLQARNALITELRPLRGDDAAFARMYFGLREGQTVDQRFRMTVESIYEMTEGVIAFAKMVGDSLLERARLKRREYVKKFPRYPAPAVSGFDFSKGKEWLPAPDPELENFERMLKDGLKQPEKPTRMGRIWSKFRRSPPAAHKQGS